MVIFRGFIFIGLFQISLESAVDEKKSFAKAVQTLKENTAKVEQNYKQMKQELHTKTQRLAEMEAEKVQLISRVESSRVEEVQTQQAAIPNPATLTALTALQQEYEILQEHTSALRHSYEVSYMIN